MNKNAIKKFAIDARNKLIASVTDKAGMIGITSDNCSEAITKGLGGKKNIWMWTAVQQDCVVLFMMQRE